MKDYQNIFKNNAVVITAVIILAMLGTLIISAFGIPFFTQSPDTYEVQEVTNFTESEDSVIVTVSDPEARDSLDVLADGQKIPWESNGSAIVNNSQYSSIRVESYSEGQLYDSYNYEYNPVGFKIEYPNRILVGNEYTISGRYDGGIVNDVQWGVNGETIENSSSSISYSFNESNKTYNISAKAQISDSTYKQEVSITPIQPDEVDLNLTVSDETVVTYEEIRFNTTEVSNESIQEVMYDYDDNNTEMIEINQSPIHWYTEPGRYNVTVSGINESTGVEGTENVTINVLSRDETVETRELSLNVYEQGGGILRQAEVSINDGLVTNTTDSNGTVQFKLPNQRNYTVNVSSDGLANKSKKIYLGKDNKFIDFRLSEPVSEANNTTNNSRELADQEIGLDINDTELENVTQNDTSPDPEGLAAVLENMAGQGTLNDPYLITRVVQLQAIQEDPDGVYTIGEDIDASQTRGWNEVTDVNEEQLGSANRTTYQLNKVDSVSRIVEGSEKIYLQGEEVPKSDYNINYNTGVIQFINGKPSSEAAVSESAVLTADYTPQSYYEGFEPIDTKGSNTIIRGSGYSINSLYINKQNQNNIGLLKDVSNANIQNIRFNNPQIIGSNNVGLIAGKAQNSEISGVRVSKSSVEGEKNVGTIAGKVRSTEISTVQVTTESNDEIVSAVIGNKSVGGIAGYALSGTSISKASVNGEVYIQANKSVGGITGRLTSSSITNSASRGGLTGAEEDVGGISGRISESEVQRSYTTSNISADEDGDRIGVVSGFSDGNYDSTYWNSEINNISDPIGNKFVAPSGITSLKTSDMKVNSAGSFTNFDFNNIWSNVDGEYPKLINAELDEQRYNLSVNTINTTNDSVESIISVSGISTKTGDSVTFEGLSPGNYELTVSSIDYAPISKDIELNSDTTENIELRKSQQIDSEIIVSNATGNIINTPGKNFEIQLDGNVNSSNPSVFDSIGEGTYDIVVNNVDGYVDDTKQDVPIAKYRPDMINMSLSNTGTSAYQVTSLGSNDTIIDKSTTLSDEIESEVVDNNTGTDNPVLRLTDEQRYSINLSELSNPDNFQIVDINGEVLLTTSSSESGTYQNDSEVNWVNQNETIEFNVTSELLDNMDRYTSTEYDAMGNDIIEVAQPDTIGVSINEFKLNKSVSINVETDPLISNANISLRQDNKTQYEKQGDSITFNNIPKGRYNIVAEAEGYNTDLISDVLISDGQNYTLNMTVSGDDNTFTINVNQSTVLPSRPVDGDQIVLETENGSRLVRNVQSGNSTYKFNSVPAGIINITYGSSDQYLEKTFTRDISNDAVTGYTETIDLVPLAIFEIKTTAGVDEKGNDLVKDVNHISVTNTTTNERYNYDINVTDDSGTANDVNTVQINETDQLPEGEYNVSAKGLVYNEEKVLRQSGESSVKVNLTNNEPSEVEVKLKSDGSGGLKVDKLNTTKTPLTDSDVNDSGDIVLVNGNRYIFKAPQDFIKYGGYPKIVGSSGITYIDGDFIRPAGISSISEDWNTSTTGSDGVWNSEQVDTGIRVSETSIEFTVTGLYEDVSMFRFNGSDQFKLIHKKQSEI